MIPFSLDESMGAIQTKAEDFRAASEPSCSENGISFRRFLFETQIGSRIPDPTKIKAVVVLTTSMELPHMNFVLQELTERSGRRLAIAGAVGVMPRTSEEEEEETDFDDLVSRSRCFDEEEDSDADAGPMLKTTGLVFAGDGVEAATVILGCEVKGQKMVEKRLNELKAAGMDEKRSCAFMFACCGRGKAHHRSEKE